MNVFMRPPQFPVPPQTEEAGEISEYLRRLHNELTEYMQLLGRDIRTAITTTDMDDLANTELADPGADRIVFWDDGAGYYTWLVPNNYLSITGVNLNVDVLPGTHVELLELGTATYDDVQDFVNQFADRGQITGMSISDNKDGTVAVAAGTGWCKTTSSINAEGRFFDFAGDASVAVSDLVVTYVYLDYNGGTPQVVVDTTGALFYDYDHIILGCVFRDGNHASFINSANSGLDTAHRIKMRLYERNGSERSSGLVSTSTGTRNLAITSGVIWTGLCRAATLSFDTSSVLAAAADDTEAYMLHDADGGFSANDVGKSVKNTTDSTYTRVVAYVDSGQLELEDDIFVNGEGYQIYDAWDYWYNTDGGSTWTHVEHSTQVSNTQYNKQAAAFGLQNLTANRFGVHWLYIDADGVNLHMVYGQGDYTSNQAEEAQIPATLPPIASQFGILLAKIICQQGTDVLTIEYPWTTTFTSTLATDHGSLGGLLDNDHTQYILHSLATAANDFLVASGAGVFAKKTLAEVGAILEGDIEHDNLQGYVANEHIDHTAVTLTAGEGLTGGGDISANRTFDLDVDGLGEDSGAKSGDFFVYYDTDVGIHYKIDFDDMPAGAGASYWTQAGTDIYYDDGGSVIVGTTAKSSKMTEGLTVYQGGSDDEIFALQSSDVNHGITTWADTDTYLNIKKNDAARGGIFMSAFTSSGATRCMNLGGWSPSVTTTKTTSGAHSVVELFAIKTSGTTFTNMDVTANLVSIYTYTGGNWYNRWWVDANGDTYQAGDFFCGDRAASQTPQQTIRRRDSNNIWIGMGGGAGWTSGDRNYTLGDYAGDALSSGFDNILLGYNAGTALTTGDANFVAGHDALEAGVDVGNCIAIGYESLESHNSGNGVIALGYHTAWADGSVPQFNIYIGHNAGGTSAALGANQIALGSAALQSCSGAENIAIGYLVCSAAMSGASNTVIGSQAGVLLAAGAQNTVVGADAGDNITSGSDNVAIGFQAGNGTATGSQNVWIGSQADGNAVAARTNSIGIGYNVSVDADNKIILGNASHTVAVINGSLFLPAIKSGATQVAAGASANELWKTASHASLPDNVVMMGV